MKNNNKQANKQIKQNNNNNKKEEKKKTRTNSQTFAVITHTHKQTNTSKCIIYYSYTDC